MSLVLRPADKDTPTGYQIAVHKECRGFYCYVKDGVTHGDKMIASDIRYFDGSQPVAGDIIPNCYECKEPVLG